LGHAHGRLVLRRPQLLALPVSHLPLNLSQLLLEPISFGDPLKADFMLVILGRKPT
ncbi:Hypothetical predicted protein, partial [Marmota monax]